MLMLNYPCKWNLLRGIINHCIPLEIRFVKNLRLKSYCAIFKLPEAVIIKLINFTRKNNFICYRFPFITVFKEISIEFYLYTI